jgi:UDP-glucuronate 4-epimerase
VLARSREHYSARVLRGAHATVLITGAAGFVGSALARRLRADGHRVRGLDLLPAGAWITHDLTANVPIDVLADVDLVVHGAALAGVQASWRRPFDYWRTNALATRLLRIACERAGAPRVVVLSSISVYGEGEHHREAAVPRPLSPYGWSKLAAERAWAGYPHATVVRLSNVYGPGQRPDMAYATFIRAALYGGAITLRDAGRQRRTPTFIDDCVAGILAAATEGAPGATYNIAGSEDIRLAAVPLLLERLLGRSVPVLGAPAAPGDPRRATVSIERATRELQFVPRMTIARGVARQLEDAL